MRTLLLLVLLVAAPVTAAELTGRDLLLALAAARSGRTVEARQALEEIAAAAAEPEIAAAALINLALLCERAGDTAGRDAHCRSFLRRFPESRMAADAVQLLGRPLALPDAVPAAPPVAELPPQVPADTAPAAPVIEIAPPLPPVVAPEPPLAAAAAADTLPVTVITVVEQAPRWEHDTAALQMFAEMAMRDRNFSLAVNRYHRLLDVSPTTAGVAFNLATAYYQLRDYRQAETWFDTAVRLDAADMEALVYRGVARFNQGRISEALSDWRMVLETDPDHVYARKMIEQHTRN